MAEPTGTEIEITPEMIEAGEAVFYRRMIDGDYLSGAPIDRDIRDMVTEIYSVMKSVKPCDRKN